MDVCDTFIGSVSVSDESDAKYSLPHDSCTPPTCCQPPGSYELVTQCNEFFKLI